MFLLSPKNNYLSKAISMRKVFSIIIIIIVLTGVVMALISWRNQKSPLPAEKVSEQNSRPLTLPPPIEPQNAAQFLIHRGFSTGDSITLGTPQGGVVVKNFYKTIVDTEEGFVWIRDNDDYRINYNTADSNFYIDIFSQPFDIARKKAEKDFLDILGVGQSDSCKLKVVEFAPAAEANLAGKNLGLSFCAGRVQ